MSAQALAKRARGSAEKQNALLQVKKEKNKRYSEIFWLKIISHIKASQPGQRSDHIHLLDWPKAMTDLWPAGWPRFPLTRIITCGSPLSIEVLQNWENGQPCYAPPDAILWKQHASKSVLALLALLTSQPGYLVSQDFLTQTLRLVQQSKGIFDDEENEEQADRALKRPENLVTALRHLPESSQRVIRNLLIWRIKASHDSGPAYRLNAQSLLWLDVEAMESYAKQAATLEQFGEPSWDAWKALSDIGFRGTFLPHEPYSDWALWLFLILSFATIPLKNAC